jgi:tetratricopeptide (TPR) repeat protein
VGLPHWYLNAYRTATDLFLRDVGLEPGEIPAQLLQPWGAGVFQEALTRHSYSLSQTLAAHCLAELGEFDQAMLQAERAVNFAHALDILYLRACADAYLGSIHLLRGDLQQALRAARHWLQTYAAADLPFPQLVMAAHLGEVFSLCGELDNALALFDRAWHFAESKNILGFAVPVVALLGEAYGRAGRTDEAVTTGERALRLARQLGQRGGEARSLYLLGNIHRCSASLAAHQAGECYQRALLLAEELGMRPLVARCHFMLGELARKAGEHREAQEQLGTATSMFRRLEMRFCLEEAESALEESSAR